MHEQSATSNNTPNPTSLPPNQAQGNANMDSAPPPNMGYSPENYGNTTGQGQHGHAGNHAPQGHPAYYNTPNNTYGMPPSEPRHAPNYANPPHHYVGHPPTYAPPPPNYHAYAQPQFVAPPAHQPPYPPPAYMPPSPAPYPYASHPQPYMHTQPHAHMHNPPHPQDAHYGTYGLGSFFNFRDERFVKGAITGAALTFLLTNESLQKNTLKSVIKFWHLLQGSVEEMKERIQDIDAEIKAEEQQKAK